MKNYLTETVDKFFDRRLSILMLENTQTLPNGWRGPSRRRQDIEKPMVKV